VRKKLARLGVTVLMLSAGLGIGAANATAAHADLREYCKAMFGSYEPELRQGIADSFMEVQELQCELNAWEPSLNLALDGQFGQQTENAVVAFQVWAHLQPDGIVGWYTWNSLDYWADHLET
jgi:peptidoglycan hydrolase-like protein with peptidoglycan-binding domain